MVVMVVLAVMPALIGSACVLGGVIFSAGRMLIGLPVFHARPFVPLVAMIPVTVLIAIGDVAAADADADADAQNIDADPNTIGACRSRHREGCTGETKGDDRAIQSFRHVFYSFQTAGNRVIAMYGSV